MAASAAPAADDSAVAIVCAVSGRVTVTTPSQKARPARLFQWLGAGTVLEAGPHGRAVLAFRDGRRQELAGGGRARVERSGAVAGRGSLRELPPVPALAEVLALKAEEQTGTRAGAVRVRGPRIRGLQPGGGAATLADRTVLVFEPVRGAAAYRVQVREAAGSLAYEATVGQGAHAVPPGALRAGAAYTWKVRTVDRPGPVAEGSESFRTLDPAAAEARERLRRQADQAADPAALALLAEVDRSLGLARASLEPPPP